MADAKPENPAELGGCVYYAQNREDLTLQSFFPDRKDGFYVDVGAFDPDVDSVTKLFYLQGWHGINIEPQAAPYKRLQATRKRDINLNVGVANQRGNVTLRVYESGGLSTISDKVKSNYEANPDEDTRKYHEETVPTLPLRTIFSDQKVTHIDFMKVDVEGLEYEVLESNDWKRYRPEVICIEANHIDRDWRPLLRAAEYELVFDDNLNEYYVDTHTARKEKFNFVEDVVHQRGGGIRADHFERLTALYAFGREKAHHVEELVLESEKLQKQKQALRNENDSMHQELNSIAATARRLRHLLWRNFRVMTGGRRG